MSLVIVLIDLCAGAGTDLSVERPVMEAEPVSPLVIVLIDLSFRPGAGTDLSVERPIVAAESCLFACCTH